jgi:hypothetical protein
MRVAEASAAVPQSPEEAWDLLIGDQMHQLAEMAQFFLLPACSVLVTRRVGAPARTPAFIYPSLGQLPHATALGGAYSRSSHQSLVEGASMIGTRVRVCEHHRIAERRGMFGKVVGYYGGDDCVAVEVRLSDGECRVFWPADLEEISPPSPSSWWRP